MKPIYESGVRMESEISEKSTEDLLRMLRDEVNAKGDFILGIQECLFKRWRQGIDLASLANLLESEKAADRLRGAYFLGEADPPGEDLKDTVIKLAADPLGYSRRTFVGYMTNSGLYDEKIAIGLANCLIDLDLNVRVATMNWAVLTSDLRFDDFSRLVEAGTGVTDSEFWRGPELKRGIRGLNIIRRLRAGETVEEIRRSTPEEDSFAWDYLQFFEKRLKRYIEKRKNKTSQN